MSAASKATVPLLLQAGLPVLRSWRWQHTALGLGLGLFNIVLGPGGGLLLWPAPEASKGYPLALLMNVTMFGLPMVAAVRCADAAVARGAAAGRAYTLAVLAVAVGGSLLGSALGLSVWGGQPANALRTAWLAVGIAVLYGLGTAAYVLRQRSAATLARSHATQAQRARQARDVQLQRLQALQAQVDPQLLFDTLGRMAALAETRPAAAQALLDELIAYLRALLPAGAQPGSHVARELALQRAHRALLQQPPLAVQAAPETLHCTLAPLLLGPLLQAWPLQHGGSRAVLSISRPAADQLLLRMAPSAADAASAPAVSESALLPLRERLQAVYAGAASLRAGPGPVLELLLPTHGTQEAPHGHGPDR